MSLQFTNFAYHFQFFTTYLERRSVSANMPPVSSNSPLNRTGGDGQGGLSIVHGKQDIPLKNLDLGLLIRNQSTAFRDRPAIIAPYPKSLRRWTYRELEENSNALAKALLSIGVSKGDRIGIFAGNRIEYCALVFAAGRIGAILVVLNTTYTPYELHRALKHAGMASHLFFISSLLLTPRQSARSFSYQQRWEERARISSISTARQI